MFSILAPVFHYWTEYPWAHLHLHVTLVWSPQNPICIGGQFNALYSDSPCLGSSFPFMFLGMHISSEQKRHSIPSWSTPPSAWASDKLINSSQSCPEVWNLGPFRSSPQKNCVLYLLRKHLQKVADFSTWSSDRGQAQLPKTPQRDRESWGGRSNNRRTAL